VYEITLLNRKTYKATELYNHITVIVINVSACWNTQCSKTQTHFGSKVWYTVGKPNSQVLATDVSVGRYYTVMLKLVW